MLETGNFFSGDFSPKKKKQKIIFQKAKGKKIKKSRLPPKSGRLTSLISKLLFIVISKHTVKCPCNAVTAPGTVTRSLTFCPWWRSSNAHGLTTAFYWQSVLGSYTSENTFLITVSLQSTELRDRFLYLLLLCSPAISLRFTISGEMLA